MFLFFVDIFISGISTQETEAQEISAQTEVSCGLQKFGKFLRQLGQNSVGGIWSALMDMGKKQKLAGVRGRD